MENTVMSQGSTTYQFHWKPFLWAQLICGTTIACIAFILDSFIQQLGVEIHPFYEALSSAVSGVLFSCIFVPIFWKLNLMTFSRYLLGAMALFIPATLVTFLISSQFYSLSLYHFNFHAITEDNQKLALAIYIRIARSAFLVPIYIFIFWLVYHKIMKKLP